jgi:hypothetical protein
LIQVKELPGTLHIRQGQFHGIRILYATSDAHSFIQGGQTMSRKAFIFCGALLVSAFSTQALAAEVKFDQQTCYTGQPTSFNTLTEWCLGRMPLLARRPARKVPRFG